MKKNLKKAVLLLAVIISMSFGAERVCADTFENENVSAKLEVKADAEDSTKADVKVTVTNNSMETLYNVNVAGNIPEGLQKLGDDAVEMTIETLGALETETLEYSVQVHAAEQEVVTPQVTQPAATPEVTAEPAKVVEQNETAEQKKQESISVQTTASGTRPSTGDNTKIGVYVILILMAAGLITVLCVKRKKAGRALALLLCVTMTAPVLLQAGPVKAAEDTNKNISLTEEFSIKDKAYTFEAEVSYEKALPTEPSGEVLTRAQWIYEMVCAAGFDGHDTTYDTITYPFTDIKNHQYENEIRIAYGNSFIKENLGGEFRPDDPATREFAAVTVVRALGFEPVKDIVCGDAGEIGYKQEVETAVAMNIMQLYENNFYPGRELTRSEADFALNGIKAILQTEEIDENYDSKINYRGQVVMIPGDIEYQINGSVVNFKPASKLPELAEGTIFVLPDQTPYKVVSVTVEDDVCTVETVEPGIEETLENIDVQGYGTMDMANFIPAEGVEIVSQNPQVQTFANIADVEGSLGGPGEIGFNIHKQVGEGQFFGSFSVNLPRVMYKADVDLGWSGANVKNVFIKAPLNVKIDGGYKISSEHNLGNAFEPKGGIFELGKVPVAGVPGVTVYVQIALKYSVEGQLHMVYKLDGTAGVQVLNNRLRMIKDLNSGLDIPQLEATVKIGPGVFGLLEICRRWNLIDFSLSVGGAMKGSITIRRPTLVCLDAFIYLYGEIGALEEGVIGDWLDLGYTYTFWDENNSPIRKHLHFENLYPVPHCTCQNGVIKGNVADGMDHGKKIQNASVKIYNKGNLNEAASLTTDENGNYETVLAEGEYVIIISADNYISFECETSLPGGETKYMETFLMVNKENEGMTGTAEGFITDALRGIRIKDAVLKFRKNWNNVTGDVEQTVTTDETGYYKVELPVGNYTAYIEKEGYVANTLNVVVLPVNLALQNAALVPVNEELPEGELRAVLTWGDQPSDLDSHLVGPKKDGNGSFHIAYYDKTYSEGDTKYADLDLDDTSSYGPETTTVYNMNETGTYSFYVHDFTNRSNWSSSAMSASEAIVEVYIGEELIGAYPVPVGKQGIYWHVFDYDAEKNTLIPVNEFVQGIAEPGAAAAAMSLAMDDKIYEKEEITK